jgi:flagellar hook assembly protein FlgD
MVDLKIMDIKGRQIRQLLNNDFAAGRHNVSWNGTNDLGAAVGSGIYFIILRTEGKVLSQKLSLIR